MPIEALDLQSVQTIFPFLEELTADLTADFLSQCQYLELPAGRFIGLEGDTCSHLALVLSGRARIYKMGQSGREVTLYRIEKGESCIMTASCILSQQSFPAFAITETDLVAIGIPAPALQNWMTQDSVWQRYIFGLLSQRLAAVMEVLEEVAFHRMDSRIAAYLLKSGNENTCEIQTTHELIAQELGSSREVVSRILKDFEKRGFLQLSRGAITHLKFLELKAIAH